MARRPPQDPSDEHGTLSALRDPVGPSDKSVYVRRRLIVLLALVAVILTIVLIVVRPGSNGGANDTKDVAVPSDLSEKPAVDAAKAGEPAACAPGSLVVTAVTDQGSYGDGEYPKLSLSVENTGEAKCVADLGTAGMSFTVSSGDDAVWRSTDCQTGAESLPVVLKAGEVLETEAVDWDRTRSSAETCDISRDPVVGGGASYHLSASAGGGESEETAQFLLY